MGGYVAVKTRVPPIGGWFEIVYDEGSVTVCRLYAGCDPH